MRPRPGFAFLLLGWLLGGTAVVFLISLGIVALDALFWLLVAVGAAALTVFAAVRRDGGARWAVLVPGLLGAGLVIWGEVTDAQGLAAFVYWAALPLWVLTAGITAATAHRAHD